MHKKMRITPSLVFLLIIFPVIFFPLYVMFIGSFKPNFAMYQLPPDLAPWNLIFTNYETVFGKLNFFQPLWNSFFVAIMTTFFTLLVATTAGYAFAKKFFYGKRWLFAVLIATMMLPRQVLMIPTFIVVKQLNLVDNLWGVILTSISAPFGVFLMKQFMQTIPTELLEAAKIDGCSEGRSFVSIVLRLSLPAIGALAIFTIIATWNDFLWQFVLIGKKALRTMPIAISSLAQEQIAKIGSQLAAAALATLPVLLIFIACQNFFIKGITMGAVKG